MLHCKQLIVLRAATIMTATRFINVTGHYVSKMSNMHENDFLLFAVEFQIVSTKILNYEVVTANATL